MCKRVLLAVVACILAGMAPSKTAAAAGETFTAGLVAHYYRDSDNWGDQWEIGASKPKGAARDSTFSAYAYSRVEPLISHLFINRGWFSVRWTGYLTVPGNTGDAAALYRFYLYADDGCRLFLDNEKVIDDFRACAETSPDAVRVAAKSLLPGRHKIVVEYFQGQSLEKNDRDPISLSWECSARKLTKQVIPETQYSHTDADFQPLPGRMDVQCAAPARRTPPAKLK